MTDTFKMVYTPLPEETKQLIIDIKMSAERLEKLLRLKSNREMSLAITNLEQCIMWATKAVAIDYECKQ